MGDGLRCRRRSEFDAARFSVVPRSVVVTDTSLRSSPNTRRVVTDRGRPRLLLGEVPGTSRCVSTFSVQGESYASVTLGGRSH